MIQTILEYCTEKKDHLKATEKKNLLEVVAQRNFLGQVGHTLVKMHLIVLLFFDRTVIRISHLAFSVYIDAKIKCIHY